MLLILFLKAVFAGIIIAAPTGPTGILCIKKTLMKKDKSGFFTGYGAATADLFYASIAGFGITIVSDFLIDRQEWFELIAGCALVILGLREWFYIQGYSHGKTRKKNYLLKDYASGFMLTLSNPITILTFFAAYTIIGIGSEHLIIDSIVLVSGSFLGSLIGWTTVNTITIIHRKNMGRNTIGKINKVSGTLFILFGSFLLVKIISFFIRSF